REAFIELPFALYADDARWIPPLRLEQRFALSEHNPFFGHGEMRCFLARGEGGAPVARAAAIINHELAPGGEPVGLVGFFESRDDAPAAEAVLDAACAWLRERGRRAAWGPVNFSIYHQYRLMTKGWDRRPFFGEP